jgi:hypothetical protein
VITTGRLPSLDTLNTNGMKFVFAPDFLKKPFDFNFFVIPREKAVENLKASFLSLEIPDVTQ